MYRSRLSKICIFLLTTLFLCSCGKSKEELEAMKKSQQLTEDINSAFDSILAYENTDNDDPYLEAIYTRFNETLVLNIVDVDAYAYNVTLLDTEAFKEQLETAGLTTELEQLLRKGIDASGLRQFVYQAILNESHLPTKSIDCSGHKNFEKEFQKMQVQMQEDVQMLFAFFDLELEEEERAVQFPEYHIGNMYPMKYVDSEGNECLVIVGFTKLLQGDDAMDLLKQNGAELGIYHNITASILEYTVTPLAVSGSTVCMFESPAVLVQNNEIVDSSINKLLAWEKTKAEIAVGETVAFRCPFIGTSSEIMTVYWSLDNVAFFIAE